MATVQCQRGQGHNRDSKGIVLSLHNWVEARDEFGMAEVEAGRSGYRLDFWSMRMSWTKRMTTGYEVKVSRDDWRRDIKWGSYLPYCERFYFVVPAGLIRPEEVSPECGLLYVHETGIIECVRRAKKRLISEPYLLQMLQRVVFKLHFKETL